MVKLGTQQKKKWLDEIASCGLSLNVEACTVVREELPLRYTMYVARTCQQLEHSTWVLQIATSGLYILFCCCFCLFVFLLEVAVQYMTGACVISCISILPICGMLWLVFIPCNLDFVLFWCLAVVCQRVL